MIFVFIFEVFKEFRGSAACRFGQCKGYNMSSFRSAWVWDCGKIRLEGTLLTSKNAVLQQSFRVECSCMIYRLIITNVIITYIIVGPQTSLFPLTLPVCLLSSSCNFE